MFTWPAAPVTTTVIGLVMLSVMSETYEQPLKNYNFFQMLWQVPKYLEKGVFMNDVMKIGRG